jgi:O-antigen/teichoic acid export membrane protein
MSYFQKQFHLLQQSPLVRRVLSGMGANSYGQMITIFLQLATIPLYLYQWTLEQYGVWLILSSIPSYISMADGGLIPVATNNVVMASARGECEKANVIFQSAFGFVLVLGAIALSLSAIFLPFFFAENHDKALAVLLLVGCVLLSIVMGLVGAIFRAENRYAYGVFLDSSGRLAEWLGGVAGLFSSGSFHGVALGMLGARAIWLLFCIYSTSRSSIGIRWGVDKFDRTELKSMMRPSLAYMAFPLSNALSFQSFTLLCGAMFGPAAVAAFNAYRTIARVPVQMTSILSHALWTEFSRLYANGERERLRAVFRKAFSLNITISVGAAFVVLGLSPLIVKYWSSGKIQFVFSLMVVFSIYSMVASFWHVSRVVVLSVNRHESLGVSLILSCVVALVAGWGLGCQMGMAGLPLGMLAGELLIAGISYLTSRRIIASAQVA